MATISNSGQTSAKSDLAELFDTIQQQRSTLIDQVQTFALGARPLFQLEAARIKAKTGVDDPRVQLLARRADNQLELVGALQVEAQIAAVRVPSIESDDTLIDGRLVDANQRAVANTPVQLVDEKNQPVAGATVTTDASGYYAIVLTPEAATALKDKKLFVAVGIGAEAKVPKASQPISVVPGGRVLQQVDLQPGEIARVGTKIDLGSILKTSGTASTGTVSTGTASPKTPAPSLSPKGAASKPKAKAPATKKATTRKKPSSR
jgi:hypothetical protein